MNREEIELKWIDKEYELLNQHYFHEDNYSLKTNTIYLSLNSLFLLFLDKAESFQLSELLATLLMLVTSVLWFFSLLRTRKFRKHAEDRISEIEQHVRKKIEEDKNDLSGKILRIRSRNSFGFPYNLPSSVLMLVFPISFILIWAIILYSHM